jgi:hypothetical protein
LQIHKGFMRGRRRESEFLGKEKSIGPWDQGDQATEIVMGQILRPYASRPSQLRASPRLSPNIHMSSNFRPEYLMGQSRQSDRLDWLSL